MAAGTLKASPSVSVVMPVRNGLPFLDEAIESILAQTFADFEFVILDDGSTDGSQIRLREWAKRDARIRLLEGKRSLGPVGSSNRVARAAQGPFVARMDADDISHPDRFGEQVQILREYAEVGLVAGMCEVMDASGRKRRSAEVWRLQRPSPFVPFAHGSIMYRRNVFDEVGGYRKDSDYWEDQDLILRMARVSKVVILPRTLYRVRQSMISSRVSCPIEHLERALDVEYRTLDELQGSPGSAADLPSQKLDPRVFIAVGAVHLWAGQRPRLLARLLRRGKLSWNFRTAAALIWAAWATLSPSTLRGMLILLVRMRNMSATAHGSYDGPLCWQPMKPVERLKMDEKIL